VHFDVVLTKELLPSCKKALSEIKPLPRTITLYGRYDSALTRIYIAGTADDVGIYVLRDGRCDAGIPILALLQKHHNPTEPQDAPALSDAEVIGVFGDALNRYAKAFGDKARFIEWLDASTADVSRGCNGPENLCPPTYHSYTSLLQNALETYRKN
jgi:hypothetical protein